MDERLPILCLDFDGVIHYYATSGWEGADVINDSPVEGAVEFIKEATSHFEVHIFSSRSHQEGGIKAMQEWLEKAIGNHYGIAPLWIDLIKWPTEKPPAHITIDDRAILFEGEWPDIQKLLDFKPWNKKD